MTTPVVRSPLHELPRLAWPAALIAVAAMTFGYMRETKPAPASEIRIEPTPTVLKDLRELSRLETLSLHVEKVIDVKDHQKRLYGLVDADDSLLFVATGEVVMGVDLAKLGDADARFDAGTRTAHVHLPAPEVLSTWFDEPRSYVHARNTDLLAKRNESLEALARRDAVVAFEGVAKDPKAIDRAKEQAEKQLRGLAKAWGAYDIVITWSAPTPPAGETGMATR